MTQSDMDSCHDLTYLDLTCITHCDHAALCSRKAVSLTIEVSVIIHADWIIRSAQRNGVVNYYRNIESTEGTCHM